VSRRDTRRCSHSLAVPVLLAALGLSACGVDPTPALPTAVAVAVTEQTAAAAVTAPVTPAPTDRPTPLPSPTDAETVTADVEPRAATSSPADIASFIAMHRINGAATLEHVAVDLDRDGEPEVLLAGLVGGVAILEVAWWGATGFEVLATGRGGAGQTITTMRVSDVNRDSFQEILIEVDSAGGASWSLWGVRGRGRLVPLSAIGGCHDGSHVYGVAGVRFVSTGSGRPSAIVATCDDSPLRVADWSEGRWEWTLGAYRVVRPAPTPMPTPTPTPAPTPTPTPAPTPGQTDSSSR
jgi:hypothetical protein